MSFGCTNWKWQRCVKLLTALSYFSYYISIEFWSMYNCACKTDKSVLVIRTTFINVRQTLQVWQKRDGFNSIRPSGKYFSRHRKWLHKIVVFKTIINGTVRTRGSAYFIWQIQKYDNAKHMLTYTLRNKQFIQQTMLGFQPAVRDRCMN